MEIEVNVAEQIRETYIRLGSQKKTAKELGLSETFVRKVLKEVYNTHHGYVFTKPTEKVKDGSIVRITPITRL